MKRLVFFFIAFLVVGCYANDSLIDPNKPKFETISFDVVQKSIVIETKISDHLNSLILGWFNNKIKVNGFDGEVKFTISDYIQEISTISDGKRVDVSLAFEVEIYKPSTSNQKFIKGNVSSYGMVTGSYNLNELDTLIQNTQNNLVLKLSSDLKLKI